jgi:hypothetical protein
LKTKIPKEDYDKMIKAFKGRVAHAEAELLRIQYTYEADDT